MNVPAPATFDGFVHADAGRLVDGQGRPRLLRGIGLGNWLLPEGYMWGFDARGPQSARQIEALIEELVGPTHAPAFWRMFRERFVAEADIERIAAEGMDHVRLPINARLVIDDAGRLTGEGVAHIDRLVEWSRSHRLWVVLDLHGAPGGQTGTNIDDSPRGLPDLFLVGGRYRDLTIALWEQLAARYRDEPVVAGYDLLNEPLPDEYRDRFAAELVALYRDLTAAIRAVDPNHLLIYEGTHWSTNWSVFTEVWDPNSALQFHKYWSPPDRPSIARYIETGRRLGLPVYMGEGGENNLDWLQTAFGLFQDCGISWSFWPWKKMATITSPCSVRPPVGWDAVTAYAAGAAARPESSTATSILADLLEAVRFERCDYRPAVVNALLHRPPVRLAATAFGFGGAGCSFAAGRARPLPGFRSDDAVTIRLATEGDARPEFHHSDGREREPGERLVVVLAPGDWVGYEVELREAARLRVRIAAGTRGPGRGDGPFVSAGGRDLPSRPVCGGFETVTAERLPAGRHSIRVAAAGAETTVSWIDVVPVG